MLFPVGDDNRDRKIKPVVNYLFIIINVVVFIYFQGCGTNEIFTYTFSAVPEEIVSGKDIVTDERIFRDPVSGDTFRITGLQPTPVSVYLTLLTSMFMHGGFAHILGNMVFLLIFGDNIENRLGHFRYFIFYLVCGVLASGAHIFTTYFFNTNPLIPTLGASGAISGVLGAYILLYPHRRVRAALLLFFIQIIELPAIVVLGLWFIFQLVNGLGVLGGGSQEGGVAYGAHIGGFIAGLILIKFFEIGRSGR